MQEIDPLTELAPFIKAACDTGESFIPPPGLSDRLLATRSTPITSHELPAPFGPYILEKILGRGASGTVYQGYHAQLDRHIAVKILAPELSALPDSRERFLREARAAANLQHENLMPLFAIHEDTPFPCLTTPLLEGETLQQKLNREGSLSVADTLPIARDIASALQHAHQSGILHRDIKPSNIFYDTKAKRAIVMDFGLARSLDARSDLTLSGTIVGTPDFLAPEQIDDHPNLTPATDLYSLGATLYALLSGQPPFSAKSLTGLLKKVAVNTPPPLKDIPPYLNDLVFSLLAKNPSDRPCSAAETLSALNQTSQKTSKSSALKFIVLGVAALLLLFVGLTQLNKTPDTPPPPFSLEAALTSKISHIIIPKSGIYDLSPFTLTRDLTITASEADTILRFRPTESNPITTSGNLILENITLRIDPPEDSPTIHTIFTSGRILNLTNCRIEHLGRERTPFVNEAIIFAEEPLDCTIDECQIFSFRAPLFRGSAGSKLQLTESLAMVPSLLKASDVGNQTLVIDRSIAVCVSLVMSSPLNKMSTVRVNHSHLEVNQTLVWIPEADFDDITSIVHWEGNHNTIASTRSLVSNASRRLRSRDSPQDIYGLAEWQAFWNCDLNSEEVPTSLINYGANFQDPPAHELPWKTFRIPHQTGPKKFRLTPAP